MSTVSGSLGIPNTGVPRQHKAGEQTRRRCIRLEDYLGAVRGHVRVLFDDLRL